MQEKVNQYFENNPEEEKVFSTSDGFLFKQEMYATAHAATITDKEVTKHTNKVGTALGQVPAVEVPVSTVTKKGAEVREKNETVEAPTIMDAPSEVPGKAEAITEVVTDQAQAVKEQATTAEAPKATAAPKAPKTAAANKAKTTTEK